MGLSRQARLFALRANLFFHLARARRQDAVSPVVADLFLTTRCNGRCAYCYTDKTIPPDKELSTAQWKSVMDDLYGLGCRMFNLMGGEPLLRSDFAELLDHAVSKNVVCDVNTNGFLVPEHLDVLKKATQIFTSLDGDETSHDANRGKGSFKKAKAGILAARRAGIPVRVNCTVTAHNVDQIGFLVDFCREHNLFLTFTPLVRVRDALKEKAGPLELSDPKARAAFVAIKQAKKKTRRIMNSDASLDFFIHYPVALGRIVWRDETGPQAGYYRQPCPYGRLQHFVVPNGDVYPCHNMWNDPGFSPKNVLAHGTARAVAHAADLRCRYCWLANLVEWNEFTKPSWLARGAWMTLRQALDFKS